MPQHPFTLRMKRESLPIAADNDGVGAEHAWKTSRILVERQFVQHLDQPPLKIRKDGCTRWWRAGGIVRWRPTLARDLGKGRGSGSPRWMGGPVPGRDLELGLVGGIDAAVCFLFARILDEVCDRVLDLLVHLPQDVHEPVLEILVLLQEF